MCKQLFFILALTSLFSTPNAHAKLSARKFRETSATSQQEKDGVLVQVHRLSTRDCAEYFEKPGLIRPLMRGKDAICPMHIHIENNSDKPFTINQHSCGLPSFTQEEMYERLKSNSSKNRFIGFCAAGATLGVTCIIATPFMLSLAMAAAIGGWSSLCIAAVASLPLCGLTAISMPIIGFYSSKNIDKDNEEIETELEQKGIDRLVIAPHSTFDGMLFAKKEGYTDQFTLALNSTDKKTALTFNIDMMG